MKQIAVSDDCWRAIKQYLVDVDGIDIGELVDACVLFAFERIDELEEELGIEEVDEEEEEEELESEEIESEED